MSTPVTIAITGLALRLPGAHTQEEFWDLLMSGVDKTAPVSQGRRDLVGAPTWNDVIGELDDIQRFDAEFFGIEPEEARYMDPQQRILMELAHDAVCDAGLAEANLTAPRRYAVYMALITNAFYPLLCQHIATHGWSKAHPRTIMNNINSAAAARVSHQYNFTGPVASIDTACSSFLTALVEAIEAITYSGCEGAVIGGANILSSPYTTIFCNQGGITTPGGITRVFDAEADGTLIGEGAVVVVLEREEIAERKNRHIYGRIVTHAINNDGASLNIMAPNPRGQAQVIQDCYAKDIDHTRIGYIEAHGTGTRIGDPIEINALSQVYRLDDFKGRVVGIGSVKSNFGHLLAAAGGAGLAKLLLSLQHGQIPPTVNLGSLNPLLELDTTPFEVVTAPRAWERIADQPRIGAITSLGLGGTNVHMVVAEGEPERTGDELPLPGLCLSAASPLALDKRIAEARRRLAVGADPYNLAMTLGRFRPSYPWRAVLRFDPEKPHTCQVSTAHPTLTIRRLLLRPTTAIVERQDLFQRLFAGPVLVTDAPPRRSDLVVVFGDSHETEALRLDPGLADQEIATHLFLAGALLRWETLFPDNQGSILTLDPYPYTHTPHWLPK